MKHASNAHEKGLFIKFQEVFHLLLLAIIIRSKSKFY